jgi:STE24 endopeptidase
VLFAMNEDRSTRYQRLRRRARTGRLVAGALVLGGCVWSGGSALLRDGALAVTNGSSIGAAIAFVVVVAVLVEIAALPFACYEGLTLERRYELTSQSAAHWWSDHAKAAGLNVGAMLLAGLTVSYLLRQAPSFWWLLAAGGAVVAMVVLTNVLPVLLPMLGACRPLQRSALVERLTAMASRAGTRVIGVFEWRLASGTRKANAALAGLGRTRRILISDTLLDRHSDDEIEVILAHELAHHVFNDIWTTVGVRGVLITVAAFTADVVLTLVVESTGAGGKADLAWLPLLALSSGVVWTALMPIANSVSRAHERRADRYALEMTRNVTAFVSAMKRLAAQNLSDDRPSSVIEWLFYTHPPVGTRIAAAHTWAARSLRDHRGRT